LWQQKAEFERLNIKVMIITFEPIKPPAISEETTGFPYYVDEERKLYSYFGLYNAGFWDLWGPRTWITYLRLLLKGRKIVKSESDIYQRGGDVLIDPHGVVRFHHVGSGPADRPDPAVICKLVKGNLYFDPCIGFPRNK
jgi:hypothetical protein